MDKLFIKETESTPYIYLCAEEAKFTIKGASYSESIPDIFEEVRSWIINNLPKIKTSMSLNFYFLMINSVTHKKMFNILNYVENYFKEGIDIKIKWYHDDDDDDVMEMGEDLLDILEMPFELVLVEDEKHDEIYENL